MREKLEKERSEMANKQLLPQNDDNTPNGCIVATNATATTVSDVNSNHTTAALNNHDNKLKNCLNGNIMDNNSINLKNGLNKSKFDSHVNHVNEQQQPQQQPHQDTPSIEPPDGGARAWCVMISAFFCNSIIFGIINTFGTIYIELHENLKAANDSEAGSKAGK